MKFDFAALDAPIEAVWPVRANVPQDGGTVVVQTFNVRFVMADETELLELGRSAEGVIDTFRKVIKGVEVDGVFVDDPAFLSKVLSKAYVRIALQTAYREFCLGLGETVSGN
ncbi:MAG: hypothetical protein AB1942_21100 [Pseudomonadota bacterium]